MAQKNDRRRYGYTDGSLAYDLDALARERALDDAGRMEQERREPAAAPRRHSAVRPAASLSCVTRPAALRARRTAARIPPVPHSFRAVLSILHPKMP